MPDLAMRAVISNTSPLLYLHSIGRLALLEQLYGRVWVTKQVADELAAGAAGGRSVPDLRSLPWCEVRQVTIPAFLGMVPDLGAGEASVIALAMETTGPRLLILDDALARRIAALHQLPLTGTAGVLLRAKERGLVERVRPLLTDLTAAGFHLRTEHMEMICRMAGE